MKSVGMRAIVFGSVVGGALLLSPYLRTHNSLKKEVIAGVNRALIEGGYGIGLNRSCSIRLSPGINGVIVCLEDVSGRTLDVLSIDASVLPRVISETIEIHDIRPTVSGTLNENTGEFLLAKAP